MKKKMLAGIGVLGPVAAMAEGATFTTPAAVTDAVSSLENAATGYAGVILPYIVAVGLAFIGISVVYLLFKVFKRFAGGK